jgi:LAO/AO transport system kinase
MLDDLIDRFLNRDRRALARLITLAARGEHLTSIQDAVKSVEGNSTVIALTGGAGVGKSTLIGRLVRHIRERNQTVAVLACDPQSPLTGGALLGDRIRMSDSTDDDGVYVRSLSAVSGHQSIAEHLDVIIDLTVAFGFQFILLETVGAGQGDTAVREIADVVVLLVQPESGDELQWQKAGVLEIANIVVVQKSDLPGAEQLEAELRDQLNLPGRPEIPVVRTSASRNLGVDELWQTIESTAKTISDA